MSNPGPECPADQESADPDRRYPPYVRTAEERRRWELAEAIATAIFDEPGMGRRWMATRSIYRSDLPTDG